MRKTKYNVALRPLATAPLIIALASSWTSQSALAACGAGQVGATAGFGPPSISVAETSSTQVLEQVRLRQMAALSEPQPPAETTQQAQAEETAPAEEAPPAEGAPAAKKAAGAKKAAPSGGGKAFYEPKGFYEPMVRRHARRDRNDAVWARGFGDWERHSNLAPGQSENPTREETLGGGMAGMDWTSHHSRRETFQIGVFGGGSAARNTYSDTAFQLEVPTADGLGTDRDFYRRTGHSQDIDGGFVGGYLTYRKNTWLSDLTFKTDFLNLSDKSVLTQFANNLGGTCGPTPEIGVQSGGASLTTYMVAGNITDRIPHGKNAWIGPTAGFRYTNTDFRDDTSVTVFGPASPNPVQFGSLGLDDGQALRLQGGVRFGESWMSPRGVVWETEVAALAYSDVWIEGFTFTSTSGGTVTPVDEGKVRALGQARAKVSLPNGVSYLLQGEVYGGEDLIGVSGQLGFRYEW